jgi:hypothetical protein
MTARQKCPLAGLTTGCCSNETSCIEEKQRVRPAVRYRKTNKEKQTHNYRHTSMQAGMYDCMRNESESELGNQRAGLLRQNKQTNMHTCVSVYVCVYEERERISVTIVTTAAQGCSCDLCMCAHVRVCWCYFANLSTVSVCLPVHTVTQTHTHTHTQATRKTQPKTCQVMIENQQVHSSTVSQHSATRNTNTHRIDEMPAKTPGGRADNWLLDKSRYLYRGETES